MKKKAEFQIKKNEKVQCELCPHYCQIKVGNSGVCGVRKNVSGTLCSLNYGEISSIGVDPIEKKPLYHFQPGSGILSVGTYGCNFKCQFCQNWTISQKTPPTKSLTPEEVVSTAKAKNVKSIAYTYSEPIVWYEFVKETSKLAKNNGLKNVLVTNGFINKDPLKKLLPYIDAANIDLKSFENHFYKTYTGGRLHPVKESIEIMADTIHIELTTLLINGLNVDNNELKELFNWIASINKSIPLHLSRYFPAYEMKRSATDSNIMKKAYNLAREYLDFVYLGNMRSPAKKNTYCPQCGKELISRNGYNTKIFFEKGECPDCHYEIEGIFI